MPWMGREKLPRAREMALMARALASFLRAPFVNEEDRRWRHQKWEFRWKRCRARKRLVWSRKKDAQEWSRMPE